APRQRARGGGPGQGAAGEAPVPGPDRPGRPAHRGRRADRRRLPPRLRGLPLGREHRHPLPDRRGTAVNRALRVVIAPDSFKGTLDAAAAAEALATGWSRVRPSDDVVVLPLADGGEGTLEALSAGLDATCLRTAVVTGPGG